MGKNDEEIPSPESSIEDGSLSGITCYCNWFQHVYVCQHMYVCTHIYMYLRNYMYQSCVYKDVLLCMW